MLKSPNGKISVAISTTSSGEVLYTVSHSNKIIIKKSKLGIIREDENFSINLILDSISNQNAAACLSSTNENRKDFVEELWNVEIPAGKYRYYDGMLYMLGLLQVSGNFKIYDFSDTAE